MQDIAIMDPVVPANNGTANKRTTTEGRQKFEEVFNGKQKSGQDPVDSKKVTDTKAKGQGTAETKAQEQVTETAGHSEDKAVVKGEDQTVVSKGQNQSTTAADQPQEATMNQAQAAVAAEAATETRTTSDIRSKLTQTLMDLVKVVKDAEGMTEEEAAEKIGSLLADLAEQLQGTDLHGEEVLAGIDLSNLADQLKQLEQSAESDDLLAELVASIQQQLAQADMPAAATTPAASVKGQAVAGETVAAARTILQQAFDNVQDAEAEQEAVVVEVAEGETKAVNETKEQVDPRFAGLLGPRQEVRGQNRQHADTRNERVVPSQQQADHAVTDEAMAAETVETLTDEAAPAHKEGFNLSQLLGQGNRQNAENLVHHPGAHGQQQPQGVEAARTTPQGQVVQLSSGQQVAESQIFDQVVTHLSGSFNGESGRMVLRLNPAELGSLKLDLVVEGDEIKANIHAQSQQVQEVLERNLPQLRHALAEQGLKIEQFQVDIDKQQGGGQFGHLADQQQQGSDHQQPWHFEEVPEEENIPLAHLMQNGGGGISLHV